MIRWITEYLGTARFSDVKEIPDVTIVDVRDMVDKKGNPSALIKCKIDEVLYALNKGDRVVVCCEHGISRSNTIACAALTKVLNESLSQIIHRYAKTMGTLQMQLGLLSSVQAVIDLETETNCESVGGLFVIGNHSYFYDQLSNLLHDIMPVHAYTLYDEGPVLLHLAVCEKKPKAILHIDIAEECGTNKSFATYMERVKNSIDVCRENNLHLYYISGYKVFNGYAREVFASEHTPLFAMDTYGLALHMAEELVIQYSSKQFVSTTIIRPAHVYGETKRLGFVNAFISACVAGKDIFVHKYTNGYPALDLLHEQDLCTALAEIVRKEISGIIHLGSSCLIEIRDIASRIQQLCGRNTVVTEENVDGNVTRIMLETTWSNKMIEWCPQVDFWQWLENQVKNGLQA